LKIPYWWLIKYKAKEFAELGLISLESEECKKIRTRYNCNSFTLEINDTVLDFGNDPRLIGIIENLNINDKEEMEINWTDRIPWQYQDYKSLYNGDVSNDVPPRWSLSHVIDIEAGKESY
jgi:hypothetical protein